MKAITIRDIKAFVTAPHGNNLVVVKVETQSRNYTELAVPLLHGATKQL